MCETQFLSGDTREKVRRTSYVWSAALMMFAMCMAIPEDGQAQQIRRKFKDKIHVRQPKPVLQKLRFELEPHFGISFNDPMHQNVRAGIAGKFHITERLSAGAFFDWYNFGRSLGGVTKAYEQTVQQNLRPDAPALNFAGGLEVGFTPIFGKFALFGTGIVFYDAVISAGAAYVDRRTVLIPNAGGSVGGTIALTTHIFLNEWISLNFEVRDMIYTTPLAGSNEESLANIAMFSVGVGFFLPTKVTRSSDPSEPSEE